MYKITFLSANTPPFVSVPYCVYVDDIDKFQSQWFVLLSDESTRLRKDFLVSKAGGIAVDFHSDDPELDMVQEDTKAMILAEKSFIFENAVFSVPNAYDFVSDIHCVKATVKLRQIIFKDHYHLTGWYRLDGVCEKDRLFSDEDNILYCERQCYGNDILEYNIAASAVNRIHNSNVVEDRTVTKYKENWIQSICYIDLAVGTEDETAIPETISSQMFEILFQDIVGEAG